MRLDLRSLDGSVLRGYQVPIAAGGDAFGDVVAAWGTPEILGRLEAMRMLLMQADRRVVSAAHLYIFHLKCTAAHLPRDVNTF